MKKCYSKEFQYNIPTIRCHFCNKILERGDGLYTVVLKWGDGRTACQDCYDQYEVDWSLHANDYKDPSYYYDED